jgi:predicted dehydrogenase
VKKLRVGVIGLGVGEQHAAAFQRHPNCDVSALCDLSEEKLDKAKDRFPGAKLYRKAEALLSDPAIDVVSIASFDDQHAEQVLKALKAGKHVFVEKPLCRTMDELKKIKAAWKKHKGKVKLSSNLVLRAAPLYKWLKAEIKHGGFGKIYAFDGEYLYGRLEKVTNGWRKNVKDYSVIAGGGIHLIDLFLWLTGEKPSRISTVGNRIASKGTDFRYMDYVAATLECPSGLLARITANFGCVHRHQHVMRIFGTKKTFIYDDSGPRLYSSRDPNVLAEMIPQPALPDSKGDLIPEFIEDILQDRDASTEIFFNDISVCAASDRALAKHSWSEVAYS